jgi:phospholipase/lecithinase/hemolysin
MRFTPCLVLLLLGLIGVRPATAAAFDRLYVFGDSYSDIGAGYVDGNGPTAVAYLAWQMGLPFTHAQAPNAGAKSLDFAVSGAQTGEGTGRHVKEALLGYGMMNQVRDFAARVGTGEIHFNPDTTLFFIAGGLNDRPAHLKTYTDQQFAEAERASTARTVANLRKEIEILQGLGGRHFTVALLPTHIPSFAAVGLRLNPALTQLVADAHAQLGLDIWLNHWGADFDEIIDHPAAYGLVNTKAPCAGRTIFDQDPTPVADPDTYFFYHPGHPSTAVHRRVGQKLAVEVAAHEPGADP